MRSCGSCKWFTKLKLSWGYGGLCELMDWLATSDSGHDCQQFKRIKFHRSLAISDEEVQLQLADSSECG